VWIGIAGFDPLPCLKGNLPARAHAKWQDFLLEQRPKIELLRITEVREAEEKTVGNEITGQIAF
jgi:hypothetical protein